MPPRTLRLGVCLPPSPHLLFTVLWPSWFPLGLYTTVGSLPASGLCICVFSEFSPPNSPLVKSSGSARLCFGSKQPQHCCSSFLIRFIYCSHDSLLWAMVALLQVETWGFKVPYICDPPFSKCGLCSCCGKRRKYEWLCIGFYLPELEIAHIVSAHTPLARPQSHDPSLTANEKKKLVFLCPGRGNEIGEHQANLCHILVKIYSSLKNQLK